ncbi:hypothetical protein [Mucilaginibacter flavidus]|uniref:hypothetical protein n=1 Tax=Mucilaginibacter flavidus TaxID=2949309 RepID=UPI002091F9C9|nr:hypothetical protein [Mucilaginibacter flavidus]MCO5946304.1 hypothetical protein [Mucilaginibacter flavidus]
MKAKPLIIELVILIVVSSLTTAMLFWVTGFHKVYGPAIDIPLHDAYFTFATKTILLPALSILIFIVYAVKEAFYRYCRRLQNLILLSSIILINICFPFGFNLVRGLAAEMRPSPNGWTIYPPLSALPKVQPNIPKEMPFEHFFNVFAYTQIFFILLLVIVAVITGKNWNPNKNVS